MMRNSEETRGYDAFISYSHSWDKDLATSFQSSLQRFACPWWRPRTMRIFRDEANLSAEPHLWGAIQTALETARYLVVMASPAAARSKWVRQEIGWWLEHRSADTLLIGWTDGTLSWDEAAGDFDWPATTALPESVMRNAHTGQPRWVDLRWLHDPEQVDTRDGRLIEDLAEFAAPIRGVGKDQLIGEHLRRRRAVRRTVASVIAMLSVLLVLTTVAGVTALVQRNNARRQTLAATSRQLVAQAAAVEDSQPELARQLLAEAYRLSPTDQAIGALIRGGGLARVLRTNDLMWDVTFDRTGDVLVAAGHKQTVLYDATRGTVRHTIPSAGDAATAVAISHDDRLLAIGHGTGRIRLYDLASGPAPVPLGEIHAWTESDNLAFSPTAPLLVVLREAAGVGVIDVSDPRAPRAIGSIDGFPTASLVRGVTVSADGRLVVSPGEDSTRVWDLSDPRHPALAATLPGPMSTAAFAPKGRLVAVGSRDDSTRLWDLTDPARPVQRALLTGSSGLGIDSVAFNHAGSVVATGAGDGLIQLWDVSDPLRPRQGDRMAGHTDNISALAFSGDDYTLASASADGPKGPSSDLGSNGSVRLWGVIGANRSSSMARLAAGQASVPALSPDGRTLAAGSPTTLYDLTDPSRLAGLGTVPTHNQGGSAVAFSPDGRNLVAGRPVQLWQVTDPARPRKLSAADVTGEGATAVAYSPTQPIIATGDRTDPVQLWDVRRPERPVVVSTLPQSRVESQTLSFRSDGQLLATLAGDGAQLWDVRRPATPVARARLAPPSGSPVSALTFSPDGRTVLTGDKGGGLTTWDVRDPVRPVRLGSVVRHSSDVTGVAYQPGTAMAATAGNDRTIRLWQLDDTSRPVEMASLSAGTRVYLPTLAFTSDGRTLVVADEYSMQLWDVDVPGILGRLCAESGPISRAQWNQYLPDQPYDPPCA